MLINLIILGFFQSTFTYHLKKKQFHEVKKDCVFSTTNFRCHQTQAIKLNLPNRACKHFLSLIAKL